MSGLLAILAGAALLWPARRPLDRARVAPPGDDLPDRQEPLPGLLPTMPIPLLSGCAVAALAAVLSTGLVAVLAGLSAAWAGQALVARKRVATEDAALGALAEALGAFGAELRSGRSVEAATGVAAAACADRHCGRALAVAVRVPEAGMTPSAHAGGGPAPAGPLTDALARISAAVLLSRRTGCSLAAVLAAVEDDLRVRIRQGRELRSATAGPRASAALLAGLPLLGLAMGSGVGADPWHVLTGTGPGQALLVAGVGLEMAGIVWCGRLVRRAVQ